MCFLVDLKVLYEQQTLYLDFALSDTSKKQEKEHSRG